MNSPIKKIPYWKKRSLTVRLEHPIWNQVMNVIEEEESNINNTVAFLIEEGLSGYNNSRFFGGPDQDGRRKLSDREINPHLYD